MIVKCLSVKTKEGLGNLLRYISREEKRRIEERKSEWNIPTKVKVTATDLKYLEQEKEDAKLLDELHKFKGTMQEFAASLSSQRDQQPKTNKKEVCGILKRNLRGQSIDENLAEYLFNERFRVNKRTNNTLAHHYILGFARKDQTRATDEKVLDLAREFMRINGNNIYYAAIHKSTESIHLHCVVSGVEYLTGKSNRISTKVFQERKLELQRIQEQKYPELSESVVGHKRWGERSQEKSKKYERERSEEKQVIQSILETAYSSARSLDEFFNAIQLEGHEVYFRNARPTGVKAFGERKYRFSRLGFESDRLNNLNDIKNDIEKELKEINEIRSGNNRSRINELDLEIEEDELERDYDGDNKQDEHEDEENDRDNEGDKPDNTAEDIEHEEHNDDDEDNENEY